METGARGREINFKRQNWEGVHIDSTYAVENPNLKSRVKILFISIIGRRRPLHKSRPRLESRKKLKWRTL